eukprot:comp6942_c0_seq1/m.2689 comp6942_c0_seq1/g.2689  ORF comp6942_c0_seq1/g.2689 comp6942_c0_seq1/m.2689 type:complete len:100 (-) comp6942_c0_seq1:651-950(-)
MQPLTLIASLLPSLCVVQAITMLEVSGRAGLRYPCQPCEAFRNLTDWAPCNKFCDRTLKIELKDRCDYCDYLGAISTYYNRKCRHYWKCDETVIDDDDL